MDNCRLKICDWWVGNEWQFRDSIFGVIGVATLLPLNHNIGPVSMDALDVGNDKGSSQMSTKPHNFII